jgi:adenine-specific DNA methylase
VSSVETSAVAVCPACGALVPLAQERWLQVHREGSAEYAYPRAGERRCAGSLLPATATAATDPS